MEKLSLFWLLQSWTFIYDLKIVTISDKLNDANSKLAFD